MNEEEDDTGVDGLEDPEFILDEASEKNPERRKKRKKFYEVPSNWTKSSVEYDWGEFTGVNPGPKQPFSSNTTPFQLFSLFFSADVLDLLLENTNWFGQNTTDNWKQLKEEELCLFLVGMMFCGIVVLPKWRDYFRKDDFGQPFLSSLFSKKRWMELLRTVHFEKLENENSEDPLWRVRRLCDLMDTKFQSAWNIGEVLVIDEGMIPYYGRTRLRQYVPRKPNSNGIKYWAIVDNFGFLYSFSIYTGKKSMKGESQQVALGMKVILLFERKIPTGNYIFVADNFFWNEYLFDHMSERGRRALTTVRCDRSDVMKGLVCKHEKWEKGMVEWVKKDGPPSKFLVGMKESIPIVAFTWKDSSQVGYYCNFIPPSNPDVNVILRNRWQSGITRTRQIPPISAFYRKYYHAVDVLNNAQVAYSPEHRTTRWTFAVFHALLKMACVNAWRMYRFINHSKDTQKEFIEKLLKEIRDLYFPPIENLSAISTSHSKSQLGVSLHIPKQQQMALPCYYCNLLKRKSYTPFICLGCATFLHPRCFYEFHLLLSKNPNQ